MTPGFDAEITSGSPPDDLAPRAPARILIVDDRPGNVLALERILEGGGHEIKSANSGRDALRVLMQQDFAVILLDVNMPDMDGFEVARLLRARERSARTPIIFVTAVNVGDSFVTQGYSLGAVDYIFSPVEPAILRAKVAVFLELHTKTIDLERTAARLRKSLHEKETLLKEVHHRVKNNLQVIASLISLQARQMDDDGARALLEECQNRVKSIALVHEMLYQARDLGRVDLADYLRRLTRQLVDTWSLASSPTEVTVDANGVLLPVDSAIPCALLVNELVTNALRHAFPGGRSGSVLVTAHSDVAVGVRLSVKDDGIGLPLSIDVSHSKTLGFELVSTLARQLGGTLDVQRSPGTRVEIAFRPTQ